MLAALGQFVFALDTIAFQELRRSTSWRHPSNSRVGAMPARQYIGPGDDTITLTGLQAPEFMGDRRALDRLREMADRGAAYALVNGAGEAFGAWVIESLEETGSIFVREGVARRIEFSIQLARVEDELADPAGGTDGGEDWGDWWEGDEWDWWADSAGPEAGGQEDDAP
ncbi:phage tail protein [Acidovorax sp. PRC11]|uniref:phage tail protein n=1 Tax=Acidovorax sp. PRC11 TaxID=2962592 RepID=UPI00288169B3|nr:phage tail protein [Acidovorax sp. PRC11]MDT0137273.1 phage tail protein [Acidovorax sp. PRC11]